MASSYSLAVEVQKSELKQVINHERPATQLSHDAISFSVGNPRVEHIEGVAHLYRDMSYEAATSQTISSLEKFSQAISSHVAVLALQPEMGMSEFCSFLGGYLPSVREMRFVRRDDAPRGDCLVLLQFDDATRAAQFYEEHNNKPFWTLEPDILCRLVFVKDVQFATQCHSGDSVDDTTTQSSTVAGLTELPTCPVCLERLDNHISGIVTTVCNHRFHNECLQRWTDTSCPVCRYCLSSESDSSRCATCDASRDLWICLICGHVGCGRYQSGHACQHWQRSHHCYALELISQRVWDYTNDTYVHRLVHSKKDGRLIEVPPPTTPQQDQAAPSAAHSAPHDANHAASGSAADERYEAEVQEALVASKLDAIGAEYSMRIQSQLEEQLKYFEGRLATTTADFEARLTVATQSAAQAESAAATCKASAMESDRLRSISEAKLAKASAKVSELARERDILEQLNKQMRVNQQSLKERLTAEAAAAAARESSHNARITEMQEQVRDLMMYIEGQRLVDQADPDLGLRQGTAGAPKQGPPAPSGSRRRPRKR